MIYGGQKFAHTYLRENQMRLLLTFVCLAEILVTGCGAAEPMPSPIRKTVDGDFSMWLEGDRPFVKIDYRTGHRVRNINSDKIIGQYCLDFFEGERFVGTYYWWNESGTDLPTAETCFVNDIKVDPNWRVKFRLRLIDVGWRDGRRTETEFDHWFRMTFWKFNSVIPVGTDKYKYALQSQPGMPDLETYLRQTGFQINAVLDFAATGVEIERRPDATPTVVHGMTYGLGETCCKIAPSSETFGEAFPDCDTNCSRTKCETDCNRRGAYCGG